MAVTISMIPVFGHEGAVDHHVRCLLWDEIDNKKQELVDAREVTELGETVLEVNDMKNIMLFEIGRLCRCYQVKSSDM